MDTMVEKGIIHPEHTQPELTLLELILLQGGLGYTHPHRDKCLQDHIPQDKCPQDNIPLDSVLLVLTHQCHIQLVPLLQDLDIHQIQVTLQFLPSIYA